MNSDSDLRGRLRALKLHDEAALPSFESVMTRRSPRAPRRWAAPAWAAGAFVLALVAGLWLTLPPADIDPAELALPAWPTPTDSLLATVGPLPGLSWSSLPTDELGRFSSKRNREQR